MVTAFASCQNLLFLSLVLVSASLTLIIASPLASSQPAVPVPSCHAHEKEALLQFKHSFIIDCTMYSDPQYGYPKVKSWTGKAEGDCCSWEGVKCNKKTGHVIGLDLTSSCLYGTFPLNNSLFSLSHLQMLSLGDNDFNHSRIPSEVGQFRKLRILNLSHSEFSGQIPSEISNLSQLSLLDLSQFDYGSTSDEFSLKLDGFTLERLIRNLAHLNTLALNAVDISSPVPIILTNLTSLRTISLQGCNLHGEFPRSIFRLPHLENLFLESNADLEGSLPDFHPNTPLRRLILDFTSFSGEIPPTIGNLAHLEVFKLINCQFSGLVPSSLGNLTKLTVLELSSNYLSGDFPYSLTNLTQLQYLALSDLNVRRPENLFSWLFKLNKLSRLDLVSMNLTGQIPSFLANFTHVTILNLSGNKLTGQIPHWLMNLTTLEMLDLSSNQLMGLIPQGISQLANLQLLSLADNNLHGNFETFLKLASLQELLLSGVRLTFPPKISTNGSFAKIRELSLISCNLTEFPRFLQSQDELELLVLSNNSICRLIPQRFVNATSESLYALDLSNNLITGFEQPTDILLWSNLQILYLSSNKIQGGIPQEICYASSLTYLDISFNNMGGKIPECIGELGASLSILNLQGNNFHGIIPRKYPKSCKLKMINLSQNQLQGKMPRSLASCSMLQVLDVGSNHINDTFPSWLGSLPKLQVLILRHNRFHGKIRTQRNSVDDFHSLRIIDLSHNFHSGDLPSHYLQNWDAMKIVDEDQSITLEENYRMLVLNEKEFDIWNYTYSITITNKGNEMYYSKILTVFRVIDFSSNNFTGRIPVSIGKLRGLQVLNLSNNNLDGNIPSSLINMRNVESLDLSSNSLTGEIPQGLVQLTYLEVFNVSYNRLMGSIPQGWQFNTFDNSSYGGNSELCGSPLSNKCGNGDEPPQQPPEVTSNVEGDDSNVIDWIVRSFGCIGGFVFGAAIGKYMTDRNHEWFVETFGSWRKKRRPQKARVTRQRRG